MPLVPDFCICFLSLIISGAIFLLCFGLDCIELRVVMRCKNLHTTELAYGDTGWDGTGMELQQTIWDEQDIR